MHPRVVVAALGLALAATGCAAPGGSPPPTPSGSPAAEAPGFSSPVGEPTLVTSGLASPWSIVRLSGGGTLVSERDTGDIRLVGERGGVSTIATVDGVVPGGEGGLLGLAESPAPADADAVGPAGDRWLYAYLTSESDNRIVRMPLGGAPGAPELGTPQPVFSGLAKARIHNGGRIAFGPDGMLYVTVGDAGSPDRAQDPASPNGKILRLTPEGAIPDDNPIDGSPVYSLGHRNPQGIAWDDTGQLYAAEFGQNTWDEFNRIDAGSNYGWPIVEGRGGDPDYTDPLAQWPTTESSPSGLAFADGTFYLAALRGERVWAIYPADLGTNWPEATEASATPWFVGEYGRIRDAVAGPAGTLWFVTSNTDSRGEPREGDDRLLEVRLEPLRES